MWRRRISAAVRWGLTGVAILLFAAWGISAFYSITWKNGSGRDYVLAHGMLGVRLWDLDAVAGLLLGENLGQSDHGLGFTRSPLPGVDWWPYFESNPGSVAIYHNLMIPCWMPC